MVKGKDANWRSKVGTFSEERGTLELGLMRKHLDQAVEVFDEVIHLDSHLSYVAPFETGVVFFRYIKAFFPEWEVSVNGFVNANHVNLIFGSDMRWASEMQMRKDSAEWWKRGQSFRRFIFDSDVSDLDLNAIYMSFGDIGPEERMMACIREGSELRVPDLLKAFKEQLRAGFLLDDERDRILSQVGQAMIPLFRKVLPAKRTKYTLDSEWWS